MMNVSRRSVQKAERVAAVSPALAQQVLEGKLSVSRAEKIVDIKTKMPRTRAKPRKKKSLPNHFLAAVAALRREIEILDEHKWRGVSRDAVKKAIREVLRMAERR